MTNVDKANLLDQLMEAQARMRVAMGTISVIAIKCQPGAADLAAMFTDGECQRTRLNVQAVEIERLTARITKLQAVADTAHAIFRHGDLAWDPVGARGARRVGLLCALRALGES